MSKRPPDGAQHAARSLQPLQSIACRSLTGSGGAGSGRRLRVQISDRLAFGTQRTNVLLCDDLARQAVNLVTLRRRPAAELLHALQKAEPEDLRIFTDPDKGC